MAGAVASAAIASKIMKKKAEKTTYKAEVIEPVEVRKMSFYEKYVKRSVDVICATGAIVVFSPLYLGVAILVKTKLGSPVLFTQDRPGLIGPDGKETVFKMYKFRTMTDERDENGELLPDDVRLTKFGKWLRNTSLDELPEAFNILNGTMSIIGPRPQLVRDMVFMSDEQRLRHTAKGACNYCGVIDTNKSVETLRNYYMLLFPTHWRHEGIPGTIIDSFASGVPVISRRWQYCDEMITNGINGLVYEWDEPNKLFNQVLYAINNPQKIIAMKENCVHAASKYLEDAVIEKICSEMKIR